MNLISLPDEMIASVLKYSSYATNDRLRKQNTQINKVAKAYEIGTTFPVTSIILTSCSWFGDLSSLPWKYTIEINSDDINCHPNLVQNNVTEFTQQFDKNNGSHLDIIDGLLKKVTLTGSLKIASFCHTVDDSLLATFAKNRKSLRNMVVFILSMTNVSCSEASAKNFIESSRKLRQYRVGFAETRMDVFYQTEMLANRHWDYFSLGNDRIESSRFKYPQLNDEFLLKVVKNCKLCSIDMCKEGEGCTSFTVDGVIKLIETLVKENITPEHILIESAYTDDYFFPAAEEKIQAIDSGLVCNFNSYCYETDDGTNRLIANNNSQVISSFFLQYITSSKTTFQDLSTSRKLHSDQIYFPSNPQDVVIEFNMIHITELEERIDDEPVDEW